MTGRRGARQVGPAGAHPDTDLFDRRAGGERGATDAETGNRPFTITTR